MPRLPLMAGAVFVVATVAVWQIVCPGRPALAMTDTTAAALIASVVVLVKARWDQWDK